MKLNTKLDITPQQWTAAMNRAVDMLNSNLDSLANEQTDFWHFAENVRECKETIAALWWLVGQEYIGIKIGRNNEVKERPN